MLKPTASARASRIDRESLPLDRRVLLTPSGVAERCAHAARHPSAPDIGRDPAVQARLPDRNPGSRRCRPRDQRMAHRKARAHTRLRRVGGRHVLAALPVRTRRRLGATRQGGPSCARKAAKPSADGVALSTAHIVNHDGSHEHHRTLGRGVWRTQRSTERAHPQQWTQLLSDQGPAGAGGPGCGSGLTTRRCGAQPGSCLLHWAPTVTARGCGIRRGGWPTSTACC
jgi:hypothetical protein